MSTVFFFNFQSFIVPQAHKYVPTGTSGPVTNNLALSAADANVAALQEKAAHLLALAATDAQAAAVVRQSSYHRALSAIDANVAALARAVSYFRAFSAAGAEVAAVTKAHGTGVVLAVPSWLSTLVDTFNRGTTSTGGAGSTTGVGNNWTDVFGSTWKLTANQLVATYTNNIIRAYLQRPSGEASLNGQYSTQFIFQTAGMAEVALGLRQQITNNTQSYLGSCAASSGGGGNALTLWSYINAGTALLSSGTNTLVSGTNYTLTMTARGVNPTSLTLTLSNTATGAVISAISCQDRTPQLQQAGQQYLLVWSANGTTEAVTFTQANGYSSDGSGSQLLANRLLSVGKLLAGAVDAQAAAVVRAVSYARSLSTSDAQSASLLRVTAAIRGAVSGEIASFARGVSYLRALSALDAQAAAVTRRISIIRGVADTQVALLVTQLLGFTSSLQLGATDGQVAGLRRVTAVLRGAADAQTAAFARMLATYRTLTAASPQTAAVARLVGLVRIAGGAQIAAVVRRTSYQRLLSAIDGEAAALSRSVAALRSLSAADAQSALLTRAVHIIRGAVDAEVSSLAARMAYFRAFTAAQAEAAAALASIIRVKLLSLSDGQVAALAETFLHAGQSTGQALAATQAQVAALIRSSSKLLGAGSPAVATFIRQVAFHKVIANSVVASTGLKRLVSALRGAANAQFASRTVAVAKTSQSGQSQATATSALRQFIRACSAAQAQAAHLVLQNFHRALLSVASAAAAAVTRSTKAIRGLLNAQVTRVSLGQALRRALSASDSDTAGLSTQRAKAPVVVGVAQAQAWLLTPLRITTHALTIVLAALSPSTASSIRGRPRSFGVAEPSSVGMLFWYHQYLPLLLRRRVVRLPGPSDISTMPPSARRSLLPVSENVTTLPGGVRRVLLPREEDEMGYQITRPEPQYFSPLDPTDQDVFTFDWTNRGYANDSIVFASVVSVPSGLNILGPCFINGSLVDITVGPSPQLQLPATFSLRCMAVFASGRISNFSIPVVVMSL